jgi:hypothetical protein
MAEWLKEARWKAIFGEGHEAARKQFIAQSANATTQAMTLKNPPIWTFFTLGLHSIHPPLG